MMVQASRTLYMGKGKVLGNKKVALEVGVLRGWEVSWRWQRIHPKTYKVAGDRISMDIYGFAFNEMVLFGWFLKLLYILVILIAAKFSIRALSRALAYIDKKVYDVSHHTHRLLEKVLKYFVYFFAFLAILSVMEMQSVLVTALAGAGVMGLAIGFAAKDVISNMLSGIFINIDKPFKYGDIIEVRGTTGKVTDMSIRTTTVESADGKVITIPNQILAQDMVTNFTRKETRWVKIPIEIAYEANLKKALDILNKILVAHKEILEEPAPEVNVTKFEESGVGIEIRGWIRTRELKKMRGVVSEVQQEIKDKFDNAGIEIPYPKRVMIDRKESGKKKK